MKKDQKKSTEIDAAFLEHNLKNDKIMLYLVAFHWFIATAVTSIQYSTYQLGFFSGGLIFMATLLAYVVYRGQKEYHIIVGIMLMLFSTLFIQQHLGRIEMHFHIFIAISFLTIYKDNYALVSATITTIIYHILFNYLQTHNVMFFGNPVSLFNYGCGYDIVILHTIFVLFEAFVIYYFIKSGQKHFRKLVLAEKKYKDVAENLEETVKERTSELVQLNDIFSEAQEITHLGNWEWNMVDNSLIWSDEIYRIFSLEPQSVIPSYDTFTSYIHPEDREEVSRRIEESVMENSPYSIIHRIILKNNEIKYVQERGYAKYDSKHTPIGMIGTVQDVTNEIKIHQELQKSEDKFKTLSKNSYTGIMVHNKNNIIYTNPQLEKITGYSGEELLKMNIWDIFVLDEKREAIRDILERRFKGEMFTEEYENVSVRSKNGSIKLVNAYSMTIEYEGEFVALSNIFDVTDSKKAEEQLQALSQIVEQTDDIIKMTNTKGVVSYVNDAFVAHTGFTRREIIGKTSNILKSGKHENSFYKKLWETITKGDIFREVFINGKKDGSFYYEEETITPIINDKNEITGYVSTGRDISERIKLEKKLSQFASTDALTGLYNRRRFEESFTTELARAERHSNPLALIMFDIDHFKAVNDMYGHDIGDNVLKGIANVIQFNLRKTDVFARWGGEEFIILAPETTSEQAERLGEKLRSAIEGYDFDIEDRVTASFGFTLYRSDSTSEQMIKRADEAMYQAKNNGRNQVVLKI